MVKWTKLNTRLLLVIAVLAFVAAAFTLGSLISQFLTQDSVHVSVIEVGILSGGICAVFIFIRAAQQLKGES